MGQSGHSGETPTTQNQNNAMSEDPRDGQRLTDKPEAAADEGGAEKKPAADRQDQVTVEEFGRQGMGVGAKE
jgi:hypothetical protein